jgi:TolA-binding protein
MAKRLCQLIVTSVLAWALSPAAWAASKEEIQLQVQLQNLSDQLTRIQKSINEGVGLMNNLATRNADTVKKLQGTLDQLRDQLGEQGTASDKQIDKISSQLNALNAALGDMKVQVDKALQPRAVTNNPPQTQTIPAQPVASAAAVAASSSPSNPPTSAPDVRGALPSAPPEGKNPQPAPVDKQELYESAMESYRAKDFEAASLEFTKYLKLDRQSENAVNAQFYLAQIEFDQSDFEGALEDFTSVGPRLPDLAKAATAQYKKALCLLQVERRDEAIPELQEVVQKYPGSPEARLAAKKLRTLRAAR